MNIQSKNWNKLTEKQRAFIEEYLQSFNTVQAYIRAGYSTNGKPATINKNAYMLLKSDAIQEALNDLLETVKDDKKHIASKVEKFLMKTLEDENTSMKDRLKSAEMLAKLAGAFDTNVNVKTNDFNFSFNISTPEEEKEEGDE